MGSPNETPVSNNGDETTAFVDIGSMITTISEESYNTLSALPKLYLVEMNFQGAGGNAIPHFGCIECLIELPFFSRKRNLCGSCCRTNSTK